MKPIERIRQANFAVAVNEKCAGHQTTAATMLEYSTPSLVNRYLSGAKDIGKTTARKIETIFGYPEYWMDSDHDTKSKTPSSTAVSDLPNTVEHEIARSLSELQKIFDAYIHASKSEREMLLNLVLNFKKASKTTKKTA